PSPCLRSRPTRRPSDPEYSNGAGYTSHLPPVTPLRPPHPARLGDPSPSDHTARRFGASAAADFSIGFQEAVRTGGLYGRTAKGPDRKSTRLNSSHVEIS